MGLRSPGRSQSRSIFSIENRKAESLLTRRSIKLKAWITVEWSRPKCSSMLGRAAGYLTAVIHRNLPAERDTLRALFRLEIRQTNMKPIRNDPLNSLDVGFAFISPNQVSQGFARKLDCNRRAGN